LLDGQHGSLMGLIGGDVAATPLDVVVSRKKELDPALHRLAGVMAK
jgi:hypothetical protein